MKYLDLYQKALGDDEQVHVWYKEKLIGHFDKGHIPTNQEVIDLVYKQTSCHICEDIDSFRNNIDLSYDVRA